MTRLVFLIVITNLMQVCSLTALLLYLEEDPNLTSAALKLLDWLISLNYDNGTTKCHGTLLLCYSYHSV